MPPALIAAAVGAAGAIGGSLISSSASKNAANAQQSAANTAANTQLSIFNQTQQNLAPYLSTGTSALNQLSSLFGLPSTSGGVSGITGAGADTNPDLWNQVLQQRPDVLANYNALTKSGVAQQQGFNTPQEYAQHWYSKFGQSQGYQLPGSTTPGGSLAGVTNPVAANALSQLTQYPGYQFGLNQGTTALDRSAASRGLLLSGAQLKDTQEFGQNYAQQQGWQPYVSQLSSLAGIGENAGAQQGTIGANTGSSVANSQLAAGQAAAGGIIGGANALTAPSGLIAGLQSAANQIGGSYGSPNISTGLNPIVYAGSAPISLTGSPDVTSGLSGYLPATLSDERTKTDLVKVGVSDAGHNVYSFRYKAGGASQLGYLAQEIVKTRPDAVHTTRSGLMLVDYDKLKVAA